MAAGEDESDCLNWKAVAALTPLIVTFVVARLSNRFGRKRTLISAHAIAAVLALPLVLPIVSGDINHYALAILLGNAMVQGMCFGPIAAARGAGLSPMIASALIMIPGTGSDLIGGVWSLVALGGIVAVAGGRPFDETSAEPLLDNSDLVLEFDEPHEASESEFTVPVTQIVESRRRPVLERGNPVLERGRNRRGVTMIGDPVELTPSVPHRRTIQIRKDQSDRHLQ